MKDSPSPCGRVKIKRIFGEGSALKVIKRKEERLQNNKLKISLPFYLFSLIYIADLPPENLSKASLLNFLTPPQGWSEKIETMKELAPAKINLYLHIEGKREDGYHLINSLMCFVDLYDEIEVENFVNIRVVCDHQINEKDNLVFKAASKLQEYVESEYNISVGAEIKLKKNIPIGAGLGGGSADAAATLRILPKLWNVEVPQEVIYKIANSLGSDISACIESVPVIAAGVGNDLEKADIDLSGLYFVLVNPMESLSTKEVYNLYHSPLEGESKNSANEVGLNFLVGGNKSRLQRNDPSPKNTAFHLHFSTLPQGEGDNHIRNDLEKPAIKLMPIIADILSDLKNQDGCLLSRMSGSGATCFGVFDDKTKAVQTEEFMNNKYGWARLCRKF